jgi:hypothetical protein
MTSLISLGAINKITREYIYPKIANKKDEYVCPDCNRDLILCQGDVRVHHFRHKVDTFTSCQHYNSPTESQIHKDAKMLLKTILEKKIPLSFIRNCSCCKKNEEYEIPEVTETSCVTLEHRFEYNNSVKIADVAYIDDGEIVCIFEICNTHKTCSENRPEPWFEIDALEFIAKVNTIISSIKITCIRCEKCEDCIKKETKESIPSFDDDTSGDFQYMRYMKQLHNSNKNDSILKHLDNVGVEYKEGNHVITITHPISNISIRRSTINLNTFINGKWIQVYLEDIVTWYKSKQGFTVQCSNCNYLCKTNEHIIVCMKCKSRINFSVKKDELIQTEVCKDIVFITNKLKESNVPMQKKKWKSLLDLLVVVDKTFLDIKPLLDTYNEYYLHITHPNTKQKIVYHLKRDEITIVNNINIYIDNKIVINYIRDWLGDSPNKLENIIKWANNHKFIELLLFLLSSPMTKINYEFVLWLNSFDSKLNILLIDCGCYNWKLENVINWLKNDGIFQRCKKCNCINSYLKSTLVCNNKYCI